MRKLLAALVVAAGLLAVVPLSSAPVPKSIKGPGTIFVWTDGEAPALNLYTPNGEHIKKVKFGTKKDFSIWSIAPGGRHALVTTTEYNALKDANDTLVHVMPLGDAEGELPAPFTCGDIEDDCWTADGRKVYVTLNAGRRKVGQRARKEFTQVFEFDTATGNTHPLELGDGHSVCDVSRDGQTLLTTSWFFQPDCDKSYFAHLVRIDPRDIQPLGEGEDLVALSFHPDGKRVFVLRTKKQRAGFGTSFPRSEFLVYNPESGEVAQLPWAVALRIAHWRCETTSWSISPDGNRVAIKWWDSYREWDEKLGLVWCAVDRLGVCDLDGKNLKVILTAPHKATDGSDSNAVISGFAWR